MTTSKFAPGAAAQKLSPHSSPGPERKPENPLENLNHQFELAADVIGLEPHLRKLLGSERAYGRGQ